MWEVCVEQDGSAQGCPSWPKCQEICSAMYRAQTAGALSGLSGQWEVSQALGTVQAQAQMETVGD